MRRHPQPVGCQTPDLVAGMLVDRVSYIAYLLTPANITARASVGLTQRAEHKRQPIAGNLADSGQLDPAAERFILPCARRHTCPDRGTSPMGALRWIRKPAMLGGCRKPEPGRAT